jgi:hypothetical protein
VRGWTVEYTSVDELELPPEMTDAMSLRLAVGVSSYKPANEPWTHYVAVFVILDETVAMR